MIRRLAALTIHSGPHENKRPTVDWNTNVVKVETFDKDERWRPLF